MRQDFLATYLTIFKDIINECSANGFVFIETSVAQTHVESDSCAGGS
jgi:hypothetical protein